MLKPLCISGHLPPAISMIRAQMSEKGGGALGEMTTQTTPKTEATKQAFVPHQVIECAPTESSQNDRVPPKKWCLGHVLSIGLTLVAVDVVFQLSQGGEGGFTMSALELTRSLVPARIERVLGRRMWMLHAHMLMEAGGSGESVGANATSKVSLHPSVGLRGRIRCIRVKVPVSSVTKCKAQLFHNGTCVGLGLELHVTI